MTGDGNWESQAGGPASVRGFGAGKVQVLLRKLRFVTGLLNLEGLVGGTAGLDKDLIFLW